MYIKNFYGENFKILTSIHTSFDPKRNFIIGSNGFGKTTLLEAIYTLFTSYSFSKQSDKDLVSQDSLSYTLQGNVLKNDLSYELFLTYQKKEAKKQYLLDKKKVPHYKTLLEQFPIVFFTPFDIQNILGEPQNRRLFFDRMISYLNPDYYKNLKEYNKVLKEKNYLLKQKNYELLDLWNERLVNLAYLIIQERLKYIHELNTMHTNQYYVYPTFLSSLQFNYKGAKNLEQLNILMKSKYMDEKHRQICLWGPHRDDIILVDKNNLKNIKSFFSLGQIKWTSFYLKLLEISLMNKELKYTPPFLIDDVFSELDTDNQEIVLKTILDLPNQIFSTSTHTNTKIFEQYTQSIFNFEQKGQLLRKNI